MHLELGIEEVVARYTATVYGVALTHTACSADADDVFQEVFSAYWKSKPNLTSEEHRKAWLIRTTLNHCLKITKSSWASKTICREDSLAFDSKENVFTEMPSADFSFYTEEQTALYQALRSLPSIYRTVVHLFYFEDLSIAQIAASLKEEQGTVKTRLSRARAQLREKLKEGKKND